MDIGYFGENVRLFINCLFRNSIEWKRTLPNLEWDNKIKQTNKFYNTHISFNKLFHLIFIRELTEI